MVAAQTPMPTTLMMFSYHSTRSASVTTDGAGRRETFAVLFRSFDHVDT